MDCFAQVRKRTLAPGAVRQRVKEDLAITAVPQAAVQEDDNATIGGAADQAPKSLTQPDDGLRHGIFVEGVFVESTAGCIERVGRHGEGEADDDQADQLVPGQVDAGSRP